ncbi:MAG TPA: transcriptional regulator [Planctomycetaceae bacterium]|jgi:DNA-binding NtrC family response regulator|nr:transcriptional regulator [Rhodopirellula sp.]MCH2359976.1 sigma-54 dependent transcriptional regulator [Pirellulales bacterium]HCK70227.1 transcriptional regulator [Planctomycetaceae bacterium]|tara:strand:- start:387 stop:1778 length:1392 start_codon:yes stop_codon:yes gene_type:complete
MMSNTHQPASPNGLQVLFTDDEEYLRELMELEIPRMGHAITVCPDGANAVHMLEQNNFDCLLVDLDMPGMNGMEVIARAKELSPELDCIILTGKSSIESAIAALRHGVFDYITKPCKLIELKSILQRVADKRQLRRNYQAVKRQLDQVQGTSQLIGETPVMAQLKSLISRVAPTDSTVLIRGETGSGKELVARSIHQESTRAEMPFVAVNCGALPENLIESELFGHCKGAFTGADQQRTGLFEVANGGTLFLDEIGELPKTMQANLLRVLESGEIRRVGDNQTFNVNVRVVCATHRNIEHMVAEGDFREDLMFRINAFELEIPPLRDRIGDLGQLIDHLVSRKVGVATLSDSINSEALTALSQHDWPGNVRELANVIEHALILCDEQMIELSHLPPRFHQVVDTPKPQSGNPVMTLRELELVAIHSALDRHDGNKTAAASELGISLKTLYNKLNQETRSNKSA